MSKRESPAERRARAAAEVEVQRVRRAKLKAANYAADGSPKNVLLDFAPFCKYDRKGLDLDIVFSAPEHPSWCAAYEQFAFTVTKDNMRELYNAAPDWGWKDGKKRAELLDADSRYAIARQRSDGTPVACAVFRFVEEGDVDVLYLFELQLSAGVQRKGLGRHLMQLLELVARKNGMTW